MASKLFSCISLLFSFSYFIFCHSHPSSNLWSEKTPSPLDFLKNLIGTHRGIQAQGLNELRNYLSKLGYINTIRLHENHDIFDDTLELAIKRYQKFYQIKVTGILDQETITLLLKPRCGVPDYFHTNPHTKLATFGHKKGFLYNVTGYSWPPNKRNHTYSFPKGTRNDGYAPVGHALTRWASVSPLNFSLIDDYNVSDVKISFETRDHGDGLPFDGPYWILAHGFFPTNGRLHFDAEEDWIVSYGEKGEFDLQTVALHEMGHILGLGHSQDPKAIMFACIGIGEIKDLTSDDIQGIHSVYPSS